jgi:hypothetical protein
MGGTRSGRTGSFRVVEVYGPDDLQLPRFVEVARQGQEAPWRLVWRYRDSLGSKLAVWFRAIAARGLEPVERIWINTGLREYRADELCRFRIEQIHRMAGGNADFLLVERRQNSGRRGTPTVAVIDGVVTRWPSRAAAARAARMDRSTVARRVGRATGWADA